MHLHISSASFILCAFSWFLEEKCSGFPVKNASEQAVQELSNGISGKPIGFVQGYATSVIQGVQNINTNTDNHGVVKSALDLRPQVNSQNIRSENGKESLQNMPVIDSGIVNGFQNKKFEIGASEVQVTSILSSDTKQSENIGKSIADVISNPVSNIHKTEMLKQQNSTSDAEVKNDDSTKIALLSHTSDKMNLTDQQMNKDQEKTAEQNIFGVLKEQKQPNDTSREGQDFHGIQNENLKNQGGNGEQIAGQDANQIAAPNVDQSREQNKTALSVNSVQKVEQVDNNVHHKLQIDIAEQNKIKVDHAAQEKQQGASVAEKEKQGNNAAETKEHGSNVAQKEELDVTVTENSKSDNLAIIEQGGNVEQKVEQGGNNEQKVEQVGKVEQKVEQGGNEQKEEHATNEEQKEEQHGNDEQNVEQGGNGEQKEEQHGNDEQNVGQHGNDEQKVEQSGNDEQKEEHGGNVEQKEPGGNVEQKEEQGGSIKQKEKHGDNVAEKDGHVDNIAQTEEQSDNNAEKEKQDDNGAKKEKQEDKVAEKQQQGDIVAVGEEQEDYDADKEKQEDNGAEEEKQEDNGVEKEKQDDNGAENEKQEDNVGEKQDGNDGQHGIDNNGDTKGDKEEMEEDMYTGRNEVKEDKNNDVEMADENINVGEAGNDNLNLDDIPDEKEEKEVGEAETGNRYANAEKLREAIRTNDAFRKVDRGLENNERNQELSNSDVGKNGKESESRFKINAGNPGLPGKPYVNKAKYDNSLLSQSTAIQRFFENFLYIIFFVLFLFVLFHCRAKICLVVSEVSRGLMTSSRKTTGDRSHGVHYKKLETSIEQLTPYDKQMAQQYIY